MIQGFVCRKILMHILQCHDMQNKVCICFIVISWKTVVKEATKQIVIMKHTEENTQKAQVFWNVRLCRG